jgi:hypothetical protein
MSTPMTDSEALAKFTTLKQKHAELEKRRLKAEATIEEAARRFQKLMEDAKTQFGANTIDELRTQVREGREKNISIIEQYEKDLLELDATLTEVEAKIKS